MSDSCESCRYWKPLRVYGDLDVVCPLGECLANPPSMTETCGPVKAMVMGGAMMNDAMKFYDTGSRFPVTKDSEWCGHFEEREATDG